MWDAFTAAAMKSCTSRPWTGQCDARQRCTKHPNMSQGLVSCRGSPTSPVHVHLGCCNLPWSSTSSGVLGSAWQVPGWKSCSRGRGRAEAEGPASGFELQDVRRCPSHAVQSGPTELRRLRSNCCQRYADERRAQEWIGRRNCSDLTKSPTKWAKDAKGGQQQLTIRRVCSTVLPRVQNRRRREQGPRQEY